LSVMGGSSGCADSGVGPAWKTGLHFLIIN